MNNTRISSPRKMVSCFEMMFVLLRKFLVMNITQISGTCSLICQKWAWGLFYSTTEIDSLPFLWFMQPTWRKATKAWSYILLGKIKYDEFKSKLCGDLKVVALLLGMQLGYIKYCCFLCKWDKKNHFVNKLWPKRTSLMPGEKNVNPPLVLPEKFYLPPLHTKLGLMKNFVKGMDKTGHGFEYVRNNFPNVRDTKIKEGIFIGPHIREVMQDKLFD